MGEMGNVNLKSFGHVYAVRSHFMQFEGGRCGAMLAWRRLAVRDDGQTECRVGECETGLRLDRGWRRNAEGAVLT